MAAAPFPVYAVNLSAHCDRVRCEPGWHLGPEWAPRLRDYDLWFVSAEIGRASCRERVSSPV